MEKTYRFYGWETADVSPANPSFKAVRDPRELYDMLSEIWCKYTCAPRLREGWSREDITRGQCSITAFLVQDIFGGQVFGVPREGGNFHCYNVVGGCVFDLTSEQFGDEKLCYEGNPEQSRQVHFAKEEKRRRYEYLRAELRRKLGLAKLVTEIDVICKEAAFVKGQLRDICMVPFEGNAHGGMFSGKVIGTGVDTQSFSKNGCCELSARYMLEGQDSSGNPCRVFVQNESLPDGSLCPEIVTDSPLLAELESAQLFSVVIPAENSVTVRIYVYGE